MGKPAALTYKDSEKEKITSESLRNKLKLKSIEVKSKFDEKYPNVKNFFKDKNLDLGKIREHSAKLLGTGALAGSLMLVSPSPLVYLPTPDELVAKLDLSKLKTTPPLANVLGPDDSEEEINEKNSSLANILGFILPKEPRPLQRNEEKVLEQVFEQVLGVSTKASLEGEHLNTTYGYIGAEQHLRRYPGDTLSQHGDSEIQKEGMAPGLSAWGYFANSESEITSDLVEKEKWYAVAQTLYLPDWSTRQPYLKNWYKHRKVMIVNVDNGKTVIAAIADSGPAAWTGKQFGGSPEVMEYLGGSSYKKGAVIMFFVDDPENKIPLGPVENIS